MKIGDLVGTVTRTAERAIEPVKQHFKETAQTATKALPNHKEANTAVKTFTDQVSGDFKNKVDMPKIAPHIPRIPDIPIGKFDNKHPKINEDIFKDTPNGPWELPKFPGFPQKNPDEMPNPGPFNRPKVPNFPPALGGISDNVDRFFKGVGDGVKNFADRAFDAGRSIFEGVTTAVGGFGRSIFESASQIIGGIGKTLNPAPLGKLFNGDIGGAWNDFKKNVTQGGKDILEGVGKALKAPISAFAVNLQNGVSAIQTLVGLEKPGRQLTQDEVNTLKGVYGDKIDYSKIRIKEGSSGLNEFLAPHTIGNTIYLPKSSEGKYNPKELLVHEAAHVWQNQNGGTDYIADSLVSQVKGFLSGGDRNAAYEYDKPIQQGKSWKELNPEQQAHLIEDAYNNNIFSNPNAVMRDKNGNDITAYVRDAMKQMREGKGAA